MHRIHSVRKIQQITSPSSIFVHELLALHLTHALLINQQSSGFEILSRLAQRFARHYEVQDSISPWCNDPLVICR